MSEAIDRDKLIELTEKKIAEINEEGPSKTRSAELVAIETRSLQKNLETTLKALDDPNITVRINPPNRIDKLIGMTTITCEGLPDPRRGHHGDFRWLIPQAAVIKKEG